MFSNSAFKIFLGLFLTSSVSGWMVPLQSSQKSRPFQVMRGTLNENEPSEIITRSKFLTNAVLTTTAFVSSLTLLSEEASAGLNPFERPKPTRPLEECLLNIARVQYTTEQIEEEINKGDYESLGKQLKMVLVNYRLEDSIKQSALYLPVGPSETKVKESGRDGFEYLNQIVEYFPDDVDPITMRKLPPQQQFTPAKLQFAVKALQASRTKLDGIFEVMPPETVKIVKDMIASEMSMEEEKIEEGEEETQS